MRVDGYRSAQITRHQSERSNINYGRRIPLACVEDTLCVCCWCNFARDNDREREKVQIDDWAGKVSAQIAARLDSSHVRKYKWLKNGTPSVRPPAYGAENFLRHRARSKTSNAISAPRRQPCKSAARDLFALRRNYSRQILILQGQILTRPGTIGLVVTHPTDTRTRPPLISRPTFC